MEFVVDKVSEDSFYENLLIGLPKVLEQFPTITDTYLNRFLPVQHNIICAWEQKHGILLPEDLRSFYGSTDGIFYSYTFSFKESTEDSNGDENVIVGKIEVNSLANLTQVFGYEITNTPGVNLMTDRYEINLGADSKVFELLNLENVGKVVLVYINSRYLPNIWVCDANMSFFFLADDFTTYLRMCIHHLGIPFWQLAYTNVGIPEWSEMIFRLLAPAILPLDKRIEDIRNKWMKLQDKPTDLVFNKIDSTIFRHSVRINPQININNVTSLNNADAADDFLAETKKKTKFRPKFQRKPLYSKK